MRPTIPLGPWRLAVDLDATRTLQTLDARPTRRCRCEACQRWAAVHAKVLPAPLATEFRRVGVEPAAPAEVSEPSRDAGRLTLRVSYFAAGRILSGPAELVAHPDGRGAGRLYAPLRGADEPLALAVAYQHTLGEPPAWLQPAPASLLAIDLWLAVPLGPVAAV